MVAEVNRQWGGVFLGYPPGRELGVAPHLLFPLTQNPAKVRIKKIVDKSQVTVFWPEHRALITPVSTLRRRKVNGVLELPALFMDEIGEASSSWKGGVLGCGYDMAYGETPLETLRRMEKEMKFGR